MRILYYLFPVAAVLLWSMNNIVSKLAATEIAPGAISFYRWVLAALLLTPFFLKAATRYKAIIRQHLLKLVILSALGMVIYQSFSYVAAHTISAANMGVILSLIPLITLMISMPVLHAQLTWGALSGIILSLYGIIFLLSGGHPDAIIHQGFSTGDVLMLIAATAYALYGVLVKYWKIPLPTWVFIYVQAVLASLILLPVYLLGPYSSITEHNIFLIAYAGIFSSVLATVLWILALHKLGAHNTSIFMNLTPVFTALIAVAVLGEHLYWYHYLGGALTLTGVLLSQLWLAPVKKVMHPSYGTTHH